MILGLYDEADDLYRREQLFEVVALRCPFQVPPRFLGRVGRGDEAHPWQCPQALDPGIGTVGRGEEHVGIQEELIQGPGDGALAIGQGRRLAVRDGVGIQAHRTDFRESLGIVLVVHSVR